ncbi:MAG: RNA polymerase sigma factor [Myxococcales bacterium]|nr:RNA polymerase sigma factor [Myxococcales bacterium]
MSDERATTTLEARLAAFVDSHRARAVSLAWRLVGGDAAAAEDVAQEAFVQAWRALPTFREEAKLSTWFYRILVREAHAWRRRARIKQVWSELTGGEAAPRAPVADDGLQRRILAAVGALSRGQREAFVLVHMEGFTVAEAAEVLKTSPGTIKSHLHRALVRLRAELADLREEGR